MRVTFLLVGFLALVSARLVQANDDLRIVALTGTPAVGVDEPFATFGQMVINDWGEVAFVGFVNEQQLSGEGDDDFSVIFGSRVGVWVDQLEEQRFVLATGDSDSDEPSIRMIKAIDMNAHGQVAIHATREGGPAIWSDYDGTPRIVAARGDLLPGVDSVLRIPTDRARFAMLDTSQVMIGDLDGHTWLTALDGTGLYRIGTEIPPGMEQPASGPYSVRFSDKTAINAQGDYLLCDRFSESSSAPSSVWITSEEDLELVARQGDSIPGGPAEVTFKRFQTFLLNNAGDVAFTAELAPGHSSGLFLHREGRLEPVVRPGTSVPDGEGTYVSGFSKFALSDTGDVAFQAWVSTEDSESTSFGIWKYADQSLHRIAAIGDHAPGRTQTTVFDGIAAPIINDLGQIVFSAMLDGEIGRQKAIWGTTQSGSLREILRVGETIEVAPGDLRTVRNIINSLSVREGDQVLTDAGEVLLHVGFEDASQAIIVSRAIASGSTLGNDLNGDGVLDVHDIDHLTRLIHSGTAPPALDQNHDQVVDRLDLSMYLAEAFDSAIADSTLDGRFTSDDLLTVFQAGEYEDGMDDNSHWSTGDWNGDYDCNSTDMVFAFQAGHYEQEDTTVAAEPSPLALIMFGALCMAVRRARRRPV